MVAGSGLRGKEWRVMKGDARREGAWMVSALRPLLMINFGLEFVYINVVVWLSSWITAQLAL